MDGESGLVVIDGVEKAVEADGEGFHSISNDWGTFFGGEDVTSKLKKIAMEGHLRGCCFRSVCWKVFLGVLPDERSRWAVAMQKKRQEYAKVRQEFLEDPRSRASAADASFNNPLSLDTESPWNLFFQDEELKKTITQDVDRTHPDMDFFQMDRIKMLMSNVLFCYARANKDIGYRQGIHELLAPIVFVLDSDKRDSDNVPQDESYTSEMLTVLDSGSLEADAYLLLDALMETCSEWYEHGPPDIRRPGKKSPVDVDDTKLFQGDEDANPSSAVVRKLERIQQVLIKKEDPELHSHLSKLAIPPQIFGLRWIRLLFAREFSLLDILMLWDAIFAHSQTLDLVDNVVLAMLLFIRDPLIAGTYLNVLQLLMNFPGVADVQYIIQRALFLQNPNVYPRPPNWQLQGGETSTTLSAPAGLRNSSRITAVRTGVTQGARSLAGKTAGLFKKPEAAHPSAAYSNSPGTSSRASSQSGSTRSAQTNTASTSSSGSRKQAPPQMSSAFTDTVRNSEDEESAAGPAKPLQPIELSPSEELSRWLDACGICGQRMETCLRSLETQLVDIEIPEGMDDRIFLAIAGLKQVRDVLRGTLGPSLSREEVESLLSIDITPVSASRAQDEEHDGKPESADSETTQPPADTETSQPPVETPETTQPPADSETTQPPVETPET